MQTRREIDHIKARLAGEIAGFDPERRGHGIGDWNRAVMAASRRR